MRRRRKSGLGKKRWEWRRRIYYGLYLMTRRFFSLTFGLEAEYNVIILLRKFWRSPDFYGDLFCVCQDAWSSFDFGIFVSFALCSTFPFREKERRFFKGRKFSQPEIWNFFMVNRILYYLNAAKFFFIMYIDKLIQFVWSM